MPTRITPLVLVVIALGMCSTYGAPIPVLRSDLPVTFTIAEGDLLHLKFPDVTFEFEGDTRLFTSPSLTVVEALIRFVNVGGAGQIYFATDPATFSSLPPLPSGDTFLNDVFLAPGESFAGSGPVTVHDPVLDPTYKCITRV